MIYSNLIKIKTTKAAMFGLDARIALAIFGALSVISGAALYSAIENAKLTSVQQTIHNVEKAFEALYLDLGELPNRASSLTKNAQYLQENPGNLTLWKGPYLTFDKDVGINDMYFLVDKILFNINNGSPAGNSCAAGSSKDGHYYLRIFYIADDINNLPTADCNVPESFAKKFHDKFDGDSDYTKGKIVIAPHSSDATRYTINIQMDLKH
tara:strand:- start:3136 stop:3765 length:630 start_codon:yes stop_codon:yes gene_type:complete